MFSLNVADVCSLLFVNGDKDFLSAAVDGTVKVWNVASKSYQQKIDDLPKGKLVLKCVMK